VAAIEGSMRDLLATARKHTQRAKAEGRGLTGEERGVVEGNMDRVAALKAERAHLMEAAADADGIRSKTGKPDGWTKAARAFSAGENKVEGPLGDYLLRGKAVTATAVQTESDIERPGIRPLAEDLRNVYQAFAQADPGGALHVDEFYVVSRDKSGAAVERDPMAVSAKSETDTTVSMETVDLRQFATLISNVPNALFGAAPQLEAYLRTAMQRELDQALDGHSLTKIDAAATLVSGGTGLVPRVRRAISDIKARGGSADTIVIPEIDLEGLDVLTEANSFPGWPFGCRVLTHPGIGGTGNGFVFDSGGAVLYKGSLGLLRDPFSAMDTNRTRLRLEYAALLMIRFPGFFAKLDESIVT
jgi:hypothetical protein